MKSLIKKPKRLDNKAAVPKDALRAPPPEAKIAQCCAKVSKAVAGCHD